MLSKKNEKLRKKCVDHWFENLMMLQLNYYSKHKLHYNIEYGSESCAFCKAYNGNYCNYCPVKIKTKRATCIGSPYYVFTNELESYEFNSLLQKVNTEKESFELLFKLISDEINFLMSL